MIKCMIVDDEPLAQQVIERHIQQMGMLTLVQKCTHVIEAFNVLQQQEINLLFLDIKMPVISGLEFMKSLEKPPAVIFTTAFSEYALDGFELDAVDYLLKPVTFSRFRRSIEKFLKQTGLPVTPEKKYIYIKVSGKLVKIFLADILYAESLKDYMKIVTIKESFVTHMTMKSLIGLLPAHSFIQVHRSFVIHSGHITSIGRKEISVHKHIIPVGDNYRMNILALEQREKQDMRK
ncbi:MAG: response regulator transcription factor [Chitinophagaceae bacterium]|nr:response regulator transcription factor [Chitinophagaceae bacterium]